MGLPGFFARFDDDRREIGAELVGMDLKPAMLGVLEREGEGGKFLLCAEPDEAALARIDVRLEHSGVARALQAVDAVSGDDEIGIGKAASDCTGTAISLLEMTARPRARRRAPEKY